METQTEITHLLLLLETDPETLLKICRDNQLKYRFANICNPKNNKFWGDYFREWFRLDYNEVGNDPFGAILNIIQNVEDDKSYVMEYGDKYVNYVLDSLYIYQDYFETSCEFGRLDWAKYYYKRSKIDLNSRDDASFVLACENGHLDVAQWLYDLGLESNSKIDIHSRYERAFRDTCRNGHLDVAQWLYDLGFKDSNEKIDIHHCDDYAFRFACQNKHLDVVKWLISLEPGYNWPEC